MLKLIIFDWDDVFTQGSTESYIRCYHAAINGVGVSLSPEEERKRVLAKWGKSYIDELTELLQEHPHLVAEAGNIYEEHLFGETFTSGLTMVEGATELLERLSGQYLLAVATGMHPRILRERVIPKFKIPDVFCQIMSVYDVEDPEHCKPHPFMVSQILEAQKVSPAEAILIGDARGDMLMARSAGVTPVAVLTGHLNLRQAQDLGVHYILPNVTHIDEVLIDLEG